MQRARAGGGAARWPRRLRLALLVAFLGWAVLAALALRDVRADAAGGRRAARDALEQLSVQALADGSSARDLRVAHERFAAARRGSEAGLLRPLRVLPVIGRQLRSLTALAEAAETMSAAGVDSLDEAERLLADPPDSASARVAAARGMEALLEDLAQEVGQVDLGPDDALVAPLAEARAELAARRDEVAGLAGDGVAVAAAVGDLLAGPRRYLVFAANNAEMRAGSGMFLLLGELSTSEGRLELGDMGSVTDVVVPPGEVPLEGDLADRWGWLEPNVEWRNLMASPRFPVNAELAAEMYRAAGRGEVDGVVAVDAVALAELVRVVGPVRVDGEEIGHRGLVEELLHGQYLRYEPDERPERQDALGAMASATLDALDAGGWEAPELIDALARASSGRHLMVWSRRPEVQAAWQGAAVDGDVAPDSLLVAVLNRGANKLDRFLRVRAELELAPFADGTAAALHLELENQVPDDLPAHLVEPHPLLDLADGAYRGVLAVTLPGAARGGRIDGVDHLAVAGADGPTRVVGFQLDVARSERRHIVVRFRLPPGMRALTVEPSARAPAVEWHARGRRWSDRFGRRVRW